MRPHQQEAAEMYEYKILTERDKRFSAGFDTDALELVLNEYSREGWRLVDTLMAQNIAKTAKTEIVLILERATLQPR